MSKRTGTDGSLLASLPWTLGALAFSVVPHVQFLPIWVTAIFLGCSAWRLQVEHKRWRLPPAWVRVPGHGATHPTAGASVGMTLASVDSSEGLEPGDYWTWIGHLEWPSP